MYLAISIALLLSSREMHVATEIDYFDTANVSELSTICRSVIIQLIASTAGKSCTTA